MSKPPLRLSKEEHALGLAIMAGRAELKRPLPDEAVITAAVTARNELIEKHAGLLRNLSKKRAKNCPLQAEDLFSLACEGAVHAADHFDPNRGPFSTCAKYWISKYFSDAIKAYYDELDTTKNYGSSVVGPTPRVADPPPKPCGQRTIIADIMDDLDHSIEWLAKRQGVSNETVRYWRQGKHVPQDPEQLVSLRNLYGHIRTNLWDASDGEWSEASYTGDEDTAIGSGFASHEDLDEFDGGSTDYGDD